MLERSRCYFWDVSVDKLSASTFLYLTCWLCYFVWVKKKLGRLLFLRVNLQGNWGTSLSLSLSLIVKYNSHTHMGLNYSLLIYGERRCYLALRSLGTFLMRENTYLFFNVFYFVLGYTSADWYKVFKTCGLDDQVLMQHTHTQTHTHIHTRYS